MHGEKFRATRRTFISGAKISSFEDILGLFVHIGRGHEISKDIFNPITLLEVS